MAQFTSLTGFRDFYPPELDIRNRIMAGWREASRRYGFEEYDGPPLEPLELYTEKSGAEIVDQLYNFVDKGGRDVALRPEMTPTLARMVGGRARGMRKPIRWYSTPQLFRYERTQRGRLREHFQWNADIIGEADVAADAEVVAVALDALRIFGLGADDVVARVSDRRLMERLLAHAGVPADQFGAVYAVIDKLNRDGEARVRERLSETAGLGPAAIDEIFRALSIDSVEALAREYRGVAGMAEEVDRLATFFEHVNDLGLREYVEFDASIVRGLAYYTGIVFEAHDRRGELRAICGGGRYDELLSAVSSEDLPAVGFAMGDVVLAELLAGRELLPAYDSGVDDYVVAIGEEQAELVRAIVGRLRDAGRAVVYALSPTGVGRQFKDADSRGAARAIVVGPEEAERGAVVVREMSTGEELQVGIENLV